MGVKRQERIANLTGLSSGEIDSIISDADIAGQWSLPVDHDVEGIVPAVDDMGTKKIPLSRVGLLTADTRLVPQNFLPSRVDAVTVGTMNADMDTFTTDETPPKVYKVSGRTSGQLVPSISTVYSHWDSDLEDYQQYRYVPLTNIGESSETGAFVPIPSDLVLKDGAGTVVTDRRDVYTRQIDISVGTPAARTSGVNTVLEIKGGKLVHTTSGVTPGTYPASQVTSPAFGGTFKVPQVTVDPTGHVTSATATDITIPSTPASTGTPGLVKINGVNGNIMPIGASSAAGGQTPDASGYYLVAAADHVHTAASLTLTHDNDSAVSGTTVYNGSADKEYDFNNILKAVLPSAAPGADNILVSTANPGHTGLEAFVSEWSTPEAAIKPEYVSTSVGSDFALASAAATHTIGVSGGSVTGLRPGKAYLLTYWMGVGRAAASAVTDVLQVSLKNGNAVVGNASSHLLDGALGNFTQYVSGTSLFIVPTAVTSLSFTVTAASGWTCAEGSVQVAEVK